MVDQKKIKIVHVINSLNYGGAENQIVQLLNGLNPLRFEKHLVTFRNLETANSRALNPEIKRYIVKRRRWGDVGCIFRLYRLLKALKVDVIQAHMYQANLFAAIAGRLAGVPVVFTTEHGRNSWKKPIHHYMEKWIISPLVNMRVAVSRNIREVRLKSGDAPEDKITVIPNCVEIFEKINKYETGKRLQIGTVGRLVPAKDYHTLIIAFNKLIEDGLNIDLVFVGDGSERSRLESMVQDLNISNCVKFAGFQEDIPAFLDKFDIFVLSSITEGIPVAMLEAMAMGVPIVATGIGGIPEVIQDNVNGLLVECRNPEMLAGAIKQLIDDNSLREKIGRAGREKIKCSFSREAICNQYEQLYVDFLRNA